MTKTNVNVIAQVLSAMLETIQEMGKDGLPEGPLYAALMGKGCSLNQFNSLVGILVKAGRVRKDGNFLYAT